MTRLRLLCAVTLLAMLTLLVTPVLADGWDEPPSKDWYFKPPYEDYTPVGMPDFDQQQDPTWVNAGGALSYCGPTAVANSLWWFDSKFEPNPVPPPIINDNYALVQAYGSWDDHDPNNVNQLGTSGMSGELIDVLAYYMDTDGQRTGLTHSGTDVEDMNAAIDKYIADKGLWDEYYRKTRWHPGAEWVFEQVEECEDVVLLLGFWVEDIEAGTFFRAGGHYVTVAGVNTVSGTIALSDPFRDHAEAGNPGFVPVAHAVHGGDTTHNDPQYTSYDEFQVTLFPPTPPGPAPYPPFVLVNYVAHHLEMMPFWGQNNSQWLPAPVPPVPPDPPRPVYTTIDYAIVVSPIYKKPGYIDYAPYGVPDFDQTQDPTWGYTDTGDGLWHWSYDGPVGEANSVWWMDSKFEPYPVLPVPPPNDNYDLVQAYGSWDDHHPYNVDPLVEALAWYMNTDGIRDPILHDHGGTYLEDHVVGKEEYLKAIGMDDQFYVKLLEEPTFKAVAEQVEDCEDVELLLGFWQPADFTYSRIGGHYVTVAGVDEEDSWIVFSDPYLDAAEDPDDPDSYGQVDYWHLPHEMTPTIHNDAQYLSHDAYYVVDTFTPGGIWGPEDYGYYVDSSTGQLMPSRNIFQNFNGLNWVKALSPTVPIHPYDESEPVYTEVEAAIVLSPGSNLTVTKEVDPDWGEVGDPITYTITYGNHDPAGTAYNVVISDQLPITYVKDITYTTSHSPNLSPSGVLTWQIGKLKEGVTGTLTITAVISDTGYFTNTVAITSTTPLETDSSDNQDAAKVLGVRSGGLRLPLVLKRD